MKQLDIFGGENYEYLLVIEPDQPTTEVVMHLRMLVNRVIPLSEEILRSKPHISICYFEANDFSDNHILSQARQIISSIQSFDMQLEGPVYWQNGTLVLKVEPNENTQELQQQLSRAFKGVIKNLHVTIARNIADKSPRELPLENHNYKGQFNCRSISLLKKKRNQPYQILETIYLMENIINS